MKYSETKQGYHDLWNRMKVTKVAAAKKQAEAIIAVKAHYEGFELPWFVLGCLHTREAGSPPDFKAVLHNGERIIGTGRKTRLVPKGRGPFNDWPSATRDALELEHLSGITDWSPERVAFVMEGFNGWGYRKKGIPSPYLWGGTSVQKPGKYVKDGVYDANKLDPQVGGMAVLKELMELDPSITFDHVDQTIPKPIDPQVDEDTTPAPAIKSKGVWGMITGALATISGALSGLWDKLDNPWALGALALILVAGSVAAYFAWRSRAEFVAAISKLKDAE